MLTTSDKQVLLNLVKNNITRLERWVTVDKRTSRLLYESSDINNKEDTAVYFDALNANREYIRKNKKHIKRLALVAKNLKIDIHKEPNITTKESMIIIEDYSRG